MRQIFFYFPYFQVTSDTNPGQLVAEVADELGIDVPIDPPAEKSPASRAKGVHFSVGDKDSGSMSEDGDEKRNITHENQTTFNMKSWRNMKTIEHPPIIDFYRNSIDTDGVFNRPSMAQLIHGKEHKEQDLGFEELNVRGKVDFCRDFREYCRKFLKFCFRKSRKRLSWPRLLG